MRTSGALLLAASCVVGALPPIAAQDPTPQRLPIKKVVLYKHGIGYFERRGAVVGDAAIELGFQTAQMQDVLKSLFALDLGGGRVSTVLYDSHDPIDKQLEDIPYRVPGASALTSLLSQLQGVRVKVLLGARTASGRVLGLEPLQQASEHGVVTRQRLVLLGDEGGVETIDVLDAQQVEVLDADVRRDLGRMMEVLGKARHVDRKTMQLRAQGNGERELRVGYIIATPIWKTSYRLLLEGDQPARLQGWAIVENRTDEDWNDVQLSFVAGSPRSFVLDLYTSYYPSRPVIDIGQAAADKEAATGFRRMAPGGPTTPGPAASAFAEAAPVPPAAAGLDAVDLATAFDETVAALAQGEAIGDLFEYAVKVPVSIARQKAALVPILAEPVGSATRALHFRADVSPHPSHAVYLDNTTGLTLEKGPVTVFEGATCLGEAMLARTAKAGMKIMLPYAFETAVEIDVQITQPDLPFTRGTLVNGVLQLQRKQVRETRYAVRNKSAKAHTLYIDHPKAGGEFALVSPAAAAEELPGHLRFAVQVAADGGAELLVREEHPLSTEVQIANQGAQQIRFWAQQTYLSVAARSLLADVVVTLEQRGALEREQAVLAEERRRLAGDQDNLRKNIQILSQAGQEARLRDEYVGRLTKAMQRVDEIDTRLQAIEAQRVEQDRKIAAMLQAFREE